MYKYTNDAVIHDSIDVDVEQLQRLSALLLVVAYIVMRIATAASRL